MPTVAEALIARHDLPPGVPAHSMGAISSVPQPHPQSPGLKRLTDLLQSVRDRTNSLFNKPQPVATAAPTVPVPPNLGSLRTSQLEGGLDALQQRSTMIKPPQPVVAPTNPTGTPTFDYGSYLQQNSIRDTEGKR